MAGPGSNMVMVVSFYDIENVQTHEIRIGNRCHACSFIPLASGRSFLFSVPRADLEKDSRIRINFWWDWQDQDGVFGGREFESWVYFNSDDLSKAALTSQGRDNKRLQLTAR